MVVFGNGFDGVAVGVSVAKDLEVKHVVDVVLEVVERLCGDFRFIGAFTTSVYSGYVGGGGGGSGQLYNNIPLTKDESIQVTIGVGGDGGASGGSRPSGDVPAEAGQQGGTTTFGTYSIEGGLGGNPATNSHHGVGGAASGNIATNGADGHRDIYPTGGSGGSRYGSYGNGGAGLFGGTPAATNKGRDGVVILTYLGG